MGVTPSSFEQHLYGRQREIWLREFVTNSGLFWLFDTLWVLSVDGVLTYVKDPVHWLLLIASVFQTYVISRTPNRRSWAGNFVAPVLYTVLDVVLEGPQFFAEPYHRVFWAYAIGMAAAYAIYPYWAAFSAIAQGVIRTSLLPAMYMVSEETVWANGQMSLHVYWFHDAGHLFILLASVLFGVLLGISTLLRDRFERLLRQLASYLERLTNWVFDPDLVVDSFDDTAKLALQRVQRTVLFMDIRGFTSWSEEHDPAEVVQMVNEFYTLAETIINQHGGFKIQMMGDEVMTRFSSAEAALQAARALQRPIWELLAPHNLGAGIGIHTGVVIEGLIGSVNTRQYGIIGDAVNTAARLQGVAQRGEIVISEETRQLIPPHLAQNITDERAISVKGKSAPIQVYIFVCPDVP